MHLSALLIAFLASTTITAALPIGTSFSEDLRAAVAQTRARERDLAASDALSDEKRAYQLETVEVATFRYKRGIDPAVLESRGVPGEQARERLRGGADRFHPDR